MLTVYRNHWIGVECRDFETAEQKRDEYLGAVGTFTIREHYGTFRVYRRHPICKGTEEDCLVAIRDRKTLDRVPTFYEVVRGGGSDS